MSSRRWRVLPAFLLFAGCASGAATTVPAAVPAPEPEGRAVVEEEPLPDIPPELLAGSEVDDIQLTRRPITLEVGESVGMAELRPTPVDAAGDPVPAPLMAAPLGGDVATLDADGMIRGLREGETELLLAVMAAGPDGAAEPRFFPVPIIVLGAPVASLEVLPPELSVYTGTAVPFGVAARTETGELRTRVDVSWTSRNPDIASVSQNGFVRGHQAGSAGLIVSAEGVEVVHVVQVRENPVQSIELSPNDAVVRTGDVVHFEAVPRGASGAPVTDLALTYSVAGEGMRTTLGASVYEDGAFVAERAGNYRVVANAGTVSVDAIAEVRPREVGQMPVPVGNGLTSHVTSSDLWVFRGIDGRDYAYVGTHDGGQKMYAWDVTDPATPVLTDSVVVDARVVNDVKVNGDATIAVITREGASDRRNGIVLPGPGGSRPPGADHDLHGGPHGWGPQHLHRR